MLTLSVLTALAIRVLDMGLVVSLFVGVFTAVLLIGAYAATWFHYRGTYQSLTSNHTNTMTGFLTLTTAMLVISIGLAGLYIVFSGGSLL